MTRKRQKPAPAVIDACCLIDLLVSRHGEAILRASGHAWHVPSAVQAEVKFVRQHDPANPGAFVNVPVDLTSHIGSGLLSLCQPDDSTEQAGFINYAKQFRSDGEAMCLALAECRGWVVATDDRKAIRVAQQAGLTVVSCPELIKAWADSTRPNAATIFQVLTDIQTLAQFRPNSTVAGSAWWFERLTST